MKLNKMEKQSSTKKITISLPEDAYTQIKEYTDFYKETYGDKISTSEIVKLIVKDYISSDKEFMKKYRKS